MKREDFLEKVYDEIDLGERTIVLDEITDSPSVIGCAYDNGKWKYYETRERGGHFVIEEFDKEEDAYDYIYELLSEEQELLNQ